MRNQSRSATDLWLNTLIIRLRRTQTMEILIAAWPPNARMYVVSMKLTYDAQK